MTENAAATSLFKKMSALRATLNDEEQALLDSLLVGEHAVTAHKMNVAGATQKASAADAEDALAHGFRALGAEKKNLASNMEDAANRAALVGAAKNTAADAEDALAHGLAYGNEKNLATNLDNASSNRVLRAVAAKNTSLDAEDAVAHRLSLNADEKANTFKITVAFNNEDETYRFF